MLSSSVTIVGCGPVGLYLALELKTAQVDDVLVIDSRKSRGDRDNFSKALGVSAGSLDMMDSRGLAPLFLEEGSSYKVPLAHFGAQETTLNLNREVLGIRHSYSLAISQARTEAILLDRCEAAGVRFGWGLKFKGFAAAAAAQKGLEEEEEEEEEQKEGVVIQAERQMAASDAEPELVEIQTSWVVGCDGTHSAVREASGIPFQGTPSTLTGLLGDVQLDQSKLPGGRGLVVRRGPWGCSLLAPIGDGIHYRFVGVFKEASHQRAGKELSMDQLREHMRAVFEGSDLGAHSPLWLSRFGSACRMASSFRSGRVLIAGDAAHQVFPAGGQGMNCGWQDASNLAWKLALVVNGHTRDTGHAEEIMDSYTRERLPQVKDLVDNVLVQLGIMSADKPHEEALRGWVTEALKVPETNALWALRVSGFGDRPEPYYGREEGEQHSLVGRRMTHLFPGDGDGGNLLENTTPRQFTLVVRQELASDVISREIQEEAGRWDGHLKVLCCPTRSIDERWDGVAAVLVRPDQRVAWVARQDMEGGPVRTSLAVALGRWIGKPASC